MIPKTTFFSPQETTCRCGCGLQVLPELLAALDRTRRFLGMPMIINSGARCNAWNNKIGGAPHSMHLKGLAADVKTLDPNYRYMLIEAVMSICIWQRVLLYKNFVHLDLKPGKKKFIYMD